MVHSLFVACRSPSESKASFRSHLRYLSEVLRLATQSQDSLARFSRLTISGWVAWWVCFVINNDYPP